MSLLSLVLRTLVICKINCWYWNELSKNSWSKLNNSLQIAVCHKLQHPFILDLLKHLIEGSYPMLEVHVQMELKRHLVEHLVQLLSCGHVLEVSPVTNDGLPSHSTSCNQFIHSPFCTIMQLRSIHDYILWLHVAGGELHAQMYEDRKPWPLINQTFHIRSKQ